jgi:hypothetical protein
MYRTANGLLLITALTSCGGPQFNPRVLSGPLSPPELVRGAEAITVGTITSLQFRQAIHANVPLFPQLNDCLVPVRVTVSVENSLRGDVGSRQLDFASFGTVCGTTGPVESPQYGARGVFFLRKDSGHWRTLADYWRNGLPVLTGRHGNELLSGKPIEQAIAEILLTPGDDCSTRSLMRAVAMSTPESVALIGPRGTRRLLRPLLNHPDMHIRATACLWLNDLGDPSENEDCAHQSVAENLDAIVQQGFGGIPPGFAFDLGRLADFSDPATRTRAHLLLSFVKTATLAPPAPWPPLPAGLR